MAAVPPPPVTLASALYGEAALWADFDPDYDAINNAVGGPSVGVTRAEVERGIVALSVNTPIAVAFQITDEPDTIYIGHSPSIYPGNPANTVNALDNRLIVFVGNDFNTAEAYVLPDDCCERLVNTRASTTAVITGNTMFAHAPAPVLRNGPHAGGAADTDALTVRRLFVLPPSLTPDLLRTNPDGAYNPPAFWTTFIQPSLDAGGADADLVAPLVEWFRVASTATTAAPGAPTPNVSPVCIALVNTNAPATRNRLNAHANRVRQEGLRRLGVGGTGLTVAAFNAGINSINTTLRDSAAASLQYQRDRDTVTFTQRYGPAIAQMMYNLCNVTQDDHLPEIHNAIANAPKGRCYAIVQNAAQVRARASVLAINALNMIVVTPKQVDQVFRSFTIACNGLEFGKGNSPFAVICEGHAEANEVAQRARQAELVETGASTSVADALLITSTKIGMPTNPKQAEEKLYGWAIITELLHGVNHPVARSITAFAAAVGPALYAVYSQAANPRVGMDHVCRILFEAQQDYFLWAEQVARTDNPALRHPVPYFTRITAAVSSFRATTLAELPINYLHLLQSSDDRRNISSSQLRQATTTMVNASPDQRLISRFRDSGKASISELMEGHDVTIPKVNGKPVCLAWLLRGQCHANCRRKDMHTAVPASAIKATHAMLTKCGVANAQE